MESKNAVYMHPLQVRPGLRYAIANEDGARVAVLIWDGKQTSEGIFFDVKVTPSYRGTQVSLP